MFLTKLDSRYFRVPFLHEITLYDWQLLTLLNNSLIQVYLLLRIYLFLLQGYINDTLVEIHFRVYFFYYIVFNLGGSLWYYALGPVLSLD